MIALTLLRQFWYIPIILLLALGVKVQTSRLDSVKQEFATFQIQVKAVGDAQEAKAKAQAATDKLKKEKNDAESAKTKRDLAGLYDAYGRLRDSRTRGGFLRPPAASAGSSENVTLNRAAADRALSEFDREVTGLIRRGDEAINDLNTARAWAR